MLSNSHRLAANSTFSALILKSHCKSTKDTIYLNELIRISNKIEESYSQLTQDLYNKFDIKFNLVSEKDRLQSKYNTLLLSASNNAFE